MLQCGLFRSNFALPMSNPSSRSFRGSADIGTLSSQSASEGLPTGTQRAQVGAGEGNRTLVISLEGFCSTIELHPPQSTLLLSTPHLACQAKLRDPNLRP